MKEIAEFIVSLFQGLKVPFRWLALLFTIFVILASLWIFEKITRNFYLIRFEKKISMLKELQQIANADIQSKSELYPIYKNLTDELASFNLREPVIASITINDPISIGKALSGAFLWMILLVVGMGSEIKKDGKITGMTIAIGVVILSIGVIAAWIGTLIPTIYNPWVNYIGYPLLQFAILFLLTRKRTNK